MMSDTTHAARGGVQANVVRRISQDSTPISGFEPIQASLDDLATTCDQCGNIARMDADWDMICTSCVADVRHDVSPAYPYPARPKRRRR